MASTINASTSAGLVSTADTSGVLQLQAAGTTVLNAELGKALALQGASSTTGCGIAFPATQVASSDVNTLDDYEEGTWTPSIQFGGAAVGQTGLFVGTYTKVGRLVTLTGAVNLTAKGSSTGSATIAGLPFSIYTSGENGDCGFALNFAENITFTGQIAVWGGSVGNPQFITNASGAARTVLTNTAFANNSNLIINFTYVTST